MGLEPHCQLCEYSLTHIVISRILQKFPPKLIYFLCSNIKKTVSWALQFHPYCPSKDLRQISTKNFFGFQKVLQKIVSGTRWFDPYHPFKNLIWMSPNAIYFLLLKFYWKIVSRTVQFDHYLPFQGFYQVFIKGSFFFLF